MYKMIKNTYWWNEKGVRIHNVNAYIIKTDASEKLHNMKQQKTYYSKKQFKQGGKYVFIY